MSNKVKTRRAQSVDDFQEMMKLLSSKDKTLKQSQLVPASQPKTVHEDVILKTEIVHEEVTETVCCEKTTQQDIVQEDIAQEVKPCRYRAFERFSPVLFGSDEEDIMNASFYIFQGCINTQEQLLRKGIEISATPVAIYPDVEELHKYYEFLWNSNEHSRPRLHYVTDSISGCRGLLRAVRELFAKKGYKTSYGHTHNTLIIYWKEKFNGSK